MEKKMVIVNAVIRRIRLAAALTVVMAGVGFGTVSLNVSAQEKADAAAQSGQLMTAQERIDAKEKPDNKAQTIFSFEAGSPVYVTGPTDGWYSVQYEDKTGYINADAVKGILVPAAMDVDELNAELKAVEEESKMIIEETERYRAESRRSKIWGGIIILLVVGIFATGIVSTVRAEKKKKGEESLDPEDSGENAEAALDSEPEGDAEETEERPGEESEKELSGGQEELQEEQTDGQEEKSTNKQYRNQMEDITADILDLDKE